MDIYTVLETIDSKSGIAEEYWFDSLCTGYAAKYAQLVDGELELIAVDIYSEE